MIKPQSILSFVLILCTILLTSYFLVVIDNENELQTLQIEEKKLSIQLLKLEIEKVNKEIL